MQELAAHPRSAWRRIELQGVSRIYKTPRILDEQVTLTGYDEPIRQITVTDLGHEEPTLLLTNQLRRSAAKLIGRYARRMLIENNIEDGVNFFHMDALSSAVALKVNCDVQLTLMASSLYRYLGQRIGHGYETAKSRHLFLDFIDATGVHRDRRTSRVGAISRSVPTTRCWSPPGSTRPTSAFRGWESVSASSLAEPAVWC